MILLQILRYLHKLENVTIANALQIEAAQLHKNFVSEFGYLAAFSNARAAHN